MNPYILPMSAAFACAMCNGAAAVLQKVSADKEEDVNSLDASFLWRLIKNKPYSAGILLDLLGWLLTLYAVRLLPLFLVETIIAVNIVFAALFESLFRKKRIQPNTYLAIGVILTGLVLLAISSSPERAQQPGATLRLCIVLAPVVIGIIGFILARRKTRLASIGLASMGGLAFGATSVIGRIFVFSNPLWHTLYDPLLFSLIASGVLGILLFSIALQRAQATVMNAAMAVSQTLIPAIVGIAFLGDDARNGLWSLVVIGTALSLGGVFILIRTTHSRQ
jgi:drug/metabolite transporter (DMT)-like permease